MMNQYGQIKVKSLIQGNINYPSRSPHEISLRQDQGETFFQRKSLAGTAISRYESRNGGNDKNLPTHIGRDRKLYTYDLEHPQYLSIFQ